MVDTHLFVSGQRQTVPGKGSENTSNDDKIYELPVRSEVNFPFPFERVLTMPNSIAAETAPLQRHPLDTNVSNALNQLTLKD